MYSSRKEVIQVKIQKPFPYMPPKQMIMHMFFLAKELGADIKESDIEGMTAGDAYEAIAQAIIAYEATLEDDDDDMDANLSLNQEEEKEIEEEEEEEYER